MRLLKLSLANWRAVDARDVRFASGVTLIEGPNEVGKSTIVEALRMLFNELDSSNKRNVKAIQPAGQDIGSRVEVEMQTGAYHFVYSKTYNKSKQTTLNILAPDKRQLTGREAHETVQQMLAQTVDMALWDALLVDQGEKVAPANLQASSGLAQALDEVAGSASAGSEDTNLISAVQAEYEKYFTLKTAKPRFAAAEDDYETAKSALVTAQEALDRVEEDSRNYERCAADVRRLRTQLPTLNAKVEEHQKSWHAVASLREKLAAKENELLGAQSIRQTALDAHLQRDELIAEIENNRQQVEAEESAQAPLRVQSETLKERVSSAGQKVIGLKQKLSSARRSFELADGDARYVQDLDAIAGARARLARLQQISEAMQSHLAVTAAIRVDDAALERFRDADSQLAIALGTRDAAATTVSVHARKTTMFEIDDVSTTLDAGETETRAVAFDFTLRLPGVVDIRITPSQTVSELQTRTQDALDALDELSRRYDVKNLDGAVMANQKRADAQRELDRLKSREEDLLQQSTRDEVALTVTALQARCDQYLRQRVADTATPDDAAKARRRVDDGRSELAGIQDALDVAQEQAQARQCEVDAQDGLLRLAQQRLAGLQAALVVKCERLDKERVSNPDEALAERAKRAGEKVEALRLEADALRSSLAAVSPEAAQAVLDNAKDARDRARKELQETEQNLAVLGDRLQHAQADGRFETFEAALHHLEVSKAALHSVRRRAESAARLWTTLNKHRNAAREAYVRPLKEAIERLGNIVFGASFQISIGDDWSLISRTLDGKTLPFDDLSLGAKEQLGILARLAAAQIVAKQGGVPLIIDDALGFADPSRLETMGAAIAAAGKHCQIIILTCTPGRFTNVGSAELVRF